MRLQDGLIIDNEKTFGVLKFSAMHREKMRQNEDGTVSDELLERVYDLKCKAQGCMIQVGIPAEVGEKEFAPDTEVILINPVAGAIATAGFNSVDVDWYVKADDIVLKGAPNVRPSRSEGVKNDGK